MFEILAPAQPRVHALNNNKKQVTKKIHGDIDRILPTSRVDDARYVMPHNLCHKICATYARGPLSSCQTLTRCYSGIHYLYI